MAQTIEAVCAFNQSIPKMRSILEDFRIMGDAKNSNPSISTETLWLTMEVWHWPAGGFTTSGVCISSYLMPCMNANSADMNECDAPVSNKTDAGTEFTRSVPITVAGWS